jgi:hypothetical protein
MRLVLLDSGPLGMVANPRARGADTRRCVAWYGSLLDAGVPVVVPEVA